MKAATYRLPWQNSRFWLHSISWLLGLSWWLVNPAWATFPSSPGEVLDEEPATVVKVGDRWFGIVPDAESGTRFAPDELPADFRRDGLKVVVSGTIGEIPRNVRLWGTPMLLSCIRFLDEGDGRTPAAAVERLPIVDKSILFHGGERYTASVTELDICSKSGCFHLRAEVDGDRYDYTVSGQVRGHERKVRSTNDTVEAWQDGEPLDVAPEREQSYRDFAMARVYFPFLPYRLNDPSVWKRNFGIVDWEGKKLHKVEVVFEAGTSTDADDEYMYWLDPATGRVEMFAYSYSDNEGGLRFRRAIDHRRVGGLLFFDQENHGVEGPGLDVGQIDPAFVADEMRLVSTIRLKNIRVEEIRGKTIE